MCARALNTESGTAVELTNILDEHDRRRLEIVLRLHPVMCDVSWWSFVEGVPVGSVDGSRNGFPDLVNCPFESVSGQGR